MFTKDMLISDIIMQHPETLTVFKEYKLDCYECQIADIETIGHGATVHRIDIEDLLAALNAAVK